MTVQESQIHTIQYLPPKGEYLTFLDVEHYKEKLKEWGLSSAKEAKKEFWYKEKNFQMLVTIKGYESYGITGEYDTIVIEFPDGNLSCIHPAYLKEMQQSSFGRESLIIVDEPDTNITANLDEETSKSEKTVHSEQADREESVTAHNEPKKEKAPKTKKEKAVKLELPTEKVHFTATVKQFALTYNAFNEENDEVVVLENVQIIQDTPLEIDYAWCSHSKTLKKYELAPGDHLEFDAKVVAKKLAKGKDAPEEFIVEVPVRYKVNNPSKIMKK